MAKQVAYKGKKTGKRRKTMTKTKVVSGVKRMSFRIIEGDYSFTVTSGPDGMIVEVHDKQGRIVDNVPDVVKEVAMLRMRTLGVEKQSAASFGQASKEILNRFRPATSP